MAYQLTGLTKGLLVVTTLGVIGSVGWNFFLKDHFAAKPATATKAATAATATTKPAPTAAATATTTATSATAPAAVGKLGTPGNPLRVSLNSFHGFAPALLANGNSLTTKPGSIFAKLGLNVEFGIADDVPTLTTLFESNAAQCSWRTSDFWAQEQPNLVNSGHDARGILLVDNTQGADAVIARDASIRNIEDLAGKSVALVQYTPSHGLLIDAINSSSMTAKAKKSVKLVFIKPEEGAAGVRAAFVAGHVDAAVTWDPDLSQALREAKGARVIYSTKTANNLIFDAIVCDQRALSNPQNDAVFQALHDGWMAGVDAARANPDQALEALLAAFPVYRELANKEGKPFVKGLFANLVWTNLADNARILGLVGGVNHYERVYTQFDQIYRAEGSLANPKSPVIPAQASYDYRFVKAALAKNAAAQAAAAKPVETYSEQGRTTAMAVPAIVTKPVTVTFATGSAEISKRAQQVLDKEVVPFIENNGSAYFELSGNTDSRGSAAVNLTLSQARAKAVADYLEKQWEIPRTRLKVVGYGSSRPLCNESNPASADMSLDDCQQLNRSTRIAVFGK